MAFSFNLTHENGELNTLFSATEDAQSMTLEIVNNNRVSVQLKKVTGDIKSNYHFALCFPPGFIEATDIVIIPETEPDLWSIDNDVNQVDGSDCFFLKWKGQQDKVMGQHQKITFTVSNIKFKNPSGLSSRNVNIVLRHRNIQEGNQILPHIQATKRSITILHTPPYDLSDIPNGGYLKLIADIAIHPLRAYISEGWNFFQPGIEKEVKITIIPNEHFFTAHNTSAEVSPVGDDSSITLESMDGGVITINTVPKNWSSVGNTVKRTNGAARITDKDEKLIITFTYTPSANSFDQTFIKIKFNSFKTKVKASLLEDDVRDTGELDFDLHVPVYIGPLSVKSEGVGIGTSSPNAKLHVQGQVYSHSSRIASYSPPTGQGAYIGWNRDGGSGRTLIASQKGLAGGDGGGGFEFITYDKDNNIQPISLTILGNGNVGIGTPTPNEKLEVNGNTKITGKLEVDDNVGIGTPTPNEKLEVNGNTKITGKLEVDGNVGIKANSNNAQLWLTANHTREFIRFGSWGNPNAANLGIYAIGVQSSTQYFRTHKNFAWYKNGIHDNRELNVGGGTTLMVIKDGNVGIGTSAPNEKLEVNGNTKITGDLNISGRINGASIRPLVKQLVRSKIIWGVAGHQEIEYTKDNIKIVETYSPFSSISPKQEGAVRKYRINAVFNDNQGPSNYSVVTFKNPSKGVSTEFKLSWVNTGDRSSTVDRLSDFKNENEIENDVSIEGIEVYIRTSKNNGKGVLFYLAIEAWDFFE